MSEYYDVCGKTDAEIIQEANEIAREFHRQNGFVVPDGFTFYDSDNPRAIKAWNFAVIAYEFLTGTDLTDVLSGIGEW